MKTDISEQWSDRSYLHSLRRRVRMFGSSILMKPSMLSNTEYFSATRKVMQGHLLGSAKGQMLSSIHFMSMKSGISKPLGQGHSVEKDCAVGANETNYSAEHEEGTELALGLSHFMIHPPEKK